MRRLVSVVPSSSASGCPVLPSSSRYWPNTEGSARLALSGKTVTSLMPMMPLRGGRASRPASAAACRPGRRLRWMVMAWRHLAPGAEQRLEAVDQREIVEAASTSAAERILMGRALEAARARPARSGARSPVDRAARDRRRRRRRLAAASAARRRCDLALEPRRPRARVRARGGDGGAPPTSPCRARPARRAAAAATTSR